MKHILEWKQHLKPLKKKKRKHHFEKETIFENETHFGMETTFENFEN